MSVNTLGTAPAPKIKRFSQLKTIDLHTKEWFDRSAGNSYFSAHVVLNYGRDNCETLYLPFQYGYGSHSEDIAAQAVAQRFPRSSHKFSSGFAGQGLRPSLYLLRENCRVVIRINKEENCLKREVVAFGEE